ncbi:hypothetical protein EDB92DRAFT_1823268 [Lactarius akahatsu]|uniref:Uncharacterized protein n=1 Tax=Lactarius akahatsu TaxID=416441 RepID=A0AAD4L7S6_9AGAM|nr:hypothetical protein EDB92DRAFT_1823268 [Lactarius akahatsu]
MSLMFSRASCLASLTPSSCSSPVTRPLSPFILSALALPNERPIITLTPLINLLDNDDNDAFLATHTPLSPSPQSRVEDDTTLNRGVKTADTSVSTPHTPHHPPLFPSCALEKPRDPDEVEPTTPHHHTSTPRPDSPAPQTAIVPTNHPLHAHIHAKRKRGYDANDKNPHKHLVRQLTIRTTPLPKFKKYQCQPTIQKYVPPKNQQMPSHYLKPGEKPKTTDSAEPLTFNAAQQHAKDPEYPINPFEADPLSAVQGFWKKYHPIDVPKEDSM